MNRAEIVAVLTPPPASVVMSDPWRPADRWHRMSRRRAQFKRSFNDQMIRADRNRFARNELTRRLVRFIGRVTRR